MAHFSSKGFTWTLKLIIALVMLVISAIPALATGTGHHHHDNEMSVHMQSMMAVKESIS